MDLNCLKSDNNLFQYFIKYSKEKNLNVHCTMNSKQKKNKTLDKLDLNGTAENIVSYSNKVDSSLINRNIILWLIENFILMKSQNKTQSETETK